MKKIPEMLTDLRDQLGFNKSQMALELRVTPSYYTGLESGERVPSETLARFIEVLWLRERRAVKETEEKEERRVKEDGQAYEGRSPWLAKATSELVFVENYGTALDKRLVMGAVDSVYEDLVERLEGKGGGVHGGNTIREPER